MKKLIEPDQERFKEIKTRQITTKFLKCKNKEKYRDHLETMTNYLQENNSDGYGFFIRNHAVHYLEPHFLSAERKELST